MKGTRCTVLVKGTRCTVLVKGTRCTNSESQSYFIVS